MISLERVTKSYHARLKVLDDVTLALGQGEFLYVLGGSGAGKTSLLRLLATEESPTAGRVSLFGYDLASVEPATLRAIRQAIGYIPQGIRLIPDLTVYDNVALAVSLAGRPSRGASVSRARVHELLECLELGAKRKALARALSGGEAQRVAIARALAREPQLVIADEPTGAQDREMSWMLMDRLIRAHLAGATVIVATHDREIVRRARKRCVALHQGRLNGVGLGANPSAEVACI